MVKQMLRQAGLHDPIHWIRSAEAAVAYLTGNARADNEIQGPWPDVVLLDLSMPEMDGYQFLSWLRRQPGLAKTVVVVITAEMDPTRIRLAYQLGANSFLSKHANVEEYRNFVDFFQTFARVANVLPKSSGAPSTLPAIARLGRSPPAEPEADTGGGEATGSQG